MDKANKVVMETSLGTVTIELVPDKAPITVANFLGYVDDKFYDNLMFHRVIPKFMIQGGGFEPGMREKRTKQTIKNESANGLANQRGTLAMARLSAPDTATAQFFINLSDNTFLDKAHAEDRVGYCVFGKVVEGMDVVDKIAAVKIAKRAGHDNVPVQDVVIRSMRRSD